MTYGRENISTSLSMRMKKDKEMILPLQYDEASGYCDNIQLMVGSRDHYDCWTELIPSADFVDYYRNADGSEFKWSAYLTGWDDLTPAQREVFSYAII